jgi:hypothetical protein
MFDYNAGLGPGRWLKWFVLAMAVYAVSTLWPENHTAVFIGGMACSIGIDVAYRQIQKARREERSDAGKRPGSNR